MEQRTDDGLADLVLSPSGQLEMNVLVTGGGGFLGLHIVEQLVARGDLVRVFCRGEYDRLAELQVEQVRGDIRDAGAVRSASTGVDTVFHCAAVPGIWGPWERYYGINTLGTQNVIESCRDAGVERLVYTSSPSVIFDGSEHLNADETLAYPKRYLSHYSRSKAIAERAVLHANSDDGLATVSLRPHVIWGPRDNHLLPRLVRRARSGQLRRVGDGSNLVSVSCVENAAAAHLQAADSLLPRSACAGRAYFINEPQPVNLWEWIDELLTLAGLPSVDSSISKRMAWNIGAVLEGIWTVLRLPDEPPMTRFVASMLSGSHYYDIKNAQSDFGYEPIVSFDATMRRLAAEWVP